MPAAAVASFTPEITGMSGTSVGARGATAVDIGRPGSTRVQTAWPDDAGHPRRQAGRAVPKTWMPGTEPGHDVKLAKSDGEVDLLLGRGGRLGIGRRVGLGCGIGRLV